jgi:hypothetical protein
MSTESREELLAFLRRHPPFQDMGSFALEALAAALKPFTVADGGQILTPNDMPPDLYIIESGQVQVRQVGDVTLTDPPLYGLEPGRAFRWRRRRRAVRPSIPTARSARSSAGVWPAPTLPPCCCRVASSTASSSTMSPGCCTRRGARSRSSSASATPTSRP